LIYSVLEVTSRTGHELQTKSDDNSRRTNAYKVHCPFSIAFISPFSQN
jgi:hypothetical protein